MMNPRVAVIILRGKQVLLMHRIKAERDYFVLPGGSVEDGESLISACRREITEETGLDVTIARELCAFENKGREEYYFLAVFQGGQPCLGEPERSRQSEENQYILEWHEVSEISELNLRPEAIREMIMAYIEHAGDYEDTAYLAKSETNRKRLDRAVKDIRDGK